MKWRMQRLATLMIGVMKMMNKIRIGLALILKGMVKVTFFLMHMILQIVKLILLFFWLILRVFTSLVNIATP